MRSKAIALAAASALFPTIAPAQTAVHQTYTATATIVAPYVFNAPTALSFGQVTSSLAGGGTVVVPNDPNTAPSLTGTALSNLSGATTGHFTVQSTALPTTAITIPSISLTSPGNPSMNVSFDPRVSLPASGTTADIYVGGTLTVAQGQPAGTYTGNFTMTITYN